MVRLCVDKVQSYVSLKTTSTGQSTYATCHEDNKSKLQVFDQTYVGSINYWKCNFPMSPSVSRSAGWLVGQSVIISKKGEKLHFNPPT